MPANKNGNCPELVSSVFGCLLQSSLGCHHENLQGQLDADSDSALHCRWFKSVLEGVM